MNPSGKPAIDLAAENAQLRTQLAKAHRVIEESHATLHQSEARYRALVEAMPDGVVVYSDWRFLYANPAALRLHGVETFKQLASRNVLEWIDPDHRSAIQARVLQMSLGERVSPRESVGLRLNGDKFTALTFTFPVFYEGRLCTQTILHDIFHSPQTEVSVHAVQESERRYRLLFDRNPDGVFTLDPAGRFLLSNPASELISGYPLDELTKKTFPELCAPDRLAYTVERFEYALRERVYTELETAIIHKDGHRVEVWIVGEAVVSGGQVTAVHCTAKDITRRKRAEEALRESEQRYRSLFSTMAEGFVLSEIVFGNEYEPSDLRVLEVNPAFEKLTGLKPSEVLGKAIDQALPGTKPGWVQRCSSVGLTGEPVRFELFSTHLKLHFELFAYSFAAGKVACIFFDTTFRKQAEDLLQSQAKHLEALVQERTAKLQETVGELEYFSYAITHDMRAPLRAISGYGELMLQESEGLSSTNRQFISRINIAAKRMDQLIVDALDYNKLVRQKFTMSFTDCEALLRGMLASYPQYHPTKAHLTIEGNIPPVLGNEALLTQCFSNLLNNAIKFVQPGRTPEVRISAERQGDRVRIWFEDNGIGIPESLREKIFIIFQRVSPTYEGTGIGLALVRKAAKRMNGTAGVESELGKGSRFWLEFKTS